MNILLILQLLFGVVLAFTGAGIFRSTPPAGGFILGGLLGITVGSFVIPGFTYSGWLPYLLFIGAGLVGALLAIPLQIVIVVISGSALGAIFGIIAGFLIQNRGFPRAMLQGTFNFGEITDLQIWLMAGMAVVFALLSIQFDDFMFYASTSFIGALMMTIALSGLGARSYALLRDGLFLFFFFMVVGMLGTIWQNYHTE